MKKNCFFALKILFTIAFLFFLQQTNLAQQIEPRLDTLPQIAIKKDVTLLALSIFPFGSYFNGVNANRYIIGNSKPLYSNRPFKPYILATQDSLAIAEYAWHRSSRPVYFIMMNSGVVLFYICVLGVVVNTITPIVSIPGGGSYGSGSSNSNNTKAETLLYLGEGLIIGGIIVKILSFAHLRKSVNRYNEVISPFKFGMSTSNLGLSVSYNF